MLTFRFLTKRNSILHSETGNFFNCEMLMDVFHSLLDSFLIVHFQGLSYTEYIQLLKLTIETSLVTVPIADDLKDRRITRNKYRNRISICLIAAKRNP